MPSAAEKAYSQLVSHFREGALLSSVNALLGWDERCLLPDAAGEYRAEQMTLLSGLVHERLTDPRVADWLDEAAGAKSAQNNSDIATSVRRLRRDYDRRLKLPKSLVEELTRAVVLGQQAWQLARRDNDYASFKPRLAEILRLKRQQAAALGGGDPYDPLLDEFEPGESTTRVANVLGALRDELVPLVQAIIHSGRQAPVEIVHRIYPVAAQQSLGHKAAESIGFDFRRGRLDVTAHPFCETLGPHDCRITTRYEERNFNGAFFGILHEAGHGMYEQGLPPDQFGLPLGQAVSMGIHESQSRLWENLVGRSHAFWEFFHRSAWPAFPDALHNVTLDQFYFAINDVRPSLIRVEADEVTYNLHILIRFELERELVAETITVDDLPAAWNAKYRDYLALDPPNDAQGVLQDIHWSAGLFGYFPTYSLGNLYAAQLFAQADRDIGPLSDLMQRGEFEPLRRWLGEKVYALGRRYDAAELVNRVTGQTLSPAALMDHLRSKFGPLYGV